MKNNFSHTLKNFFLHYLIATSLVVIVIAICLFDTTLVSLRNFRNIISDAAPMLLMSSGMALCLFSGYVDLSAGSVATFAGIIAGSLVQRADIAGKIIPFLPPLPIFVVIPVLLAIFYALGMFYGFFLYKSKIPSWVFTLATSSVLMGIGYMYVSLPEINSMQVTGFSSQFLQFGAGYIGSNPTYSVPFTILVSIIMLALIWLLLQHKKLELKGTDNNLDRRNSKRNLKTMYGCAVLLFALSGLMITARNGSATPTIGFGLTSDALVICLIAAFSLKGGKGNLRTIFIATIIYTSLIYCVTYVGINHYISLVLRGIIIICALLLETYMQQKTKPQTDKE